MIKYQMRGEVIATTKTKKGKHIVSLWDYDPSHLPVNGMFSPLTPDTLPETGEGIYLVVTHNNFTTITPLIIERKENKQ